MIPKFFEVNVLLGPPKTKCTRVEKKGAAPFNFFFSDCEESKTEVAYFVIKVNLCAAALISL